MNQTNMNQRASRMAVENPPLLHSDDPSAPFRVDLERIRFSPFYSRLSAVTQVIGQSGGRSSIHNRLTHSLKVSSVAHAIALRMRSLIEADGTLPPEYVCDAAVVRTAASAHDLGHPPFGHHGETVLDRLARNLLGLADGYEGNAQTYRIVATLDVSHGSPRGLNLSAASRSAVAKYPWLPSIELDPAEHPQVPPGLRWVDGELSARKYSAYFLDALDLFDARSVSHGLLPLQQSFECSVMDIADDIAYSVHDVEDFHRAGLLSHAAIGHEFHGWLDRMTELREMDEDELTSRRAPAGSALEQLRRKTVADDPWVADYDVFWEAVRNVSTDLVDGLLTDGFDGSIADERSLEAFTRRWISHLQASVVLAPRDNPRTGLVMLDTLAWHEVEVLKFIHKHFVLERSDIAMYQRGLGRLLTRAVKGLVSWLDDDHDQQRVPLRLRELVEMATEGYDMLAREQLPGVPVIEPKKVRKLGRGRGVLDYVASFTDEQAIAVAEAIDGRPDRFWEIGHTL